MHNPPQVTLVCVGVTVMAGGLIRVALTDVVQPFTSVNVAEIGPGHRPPLVAVPPAITADVPPGVKLTVQFGEPPDGEKVNAPEQELLHEIGVKIDPVFNANGVSTERVKVAVQEFTSAAVIVSIPAHKFDIVAVPLELKVDVAAPGGARVKE